MDTRDDETDGVEEPDDQVSHTPPRPEGVRIIGAQEAAEAVARGDAGKRRAEGEPGYGDRPEPLSDDDRPVLRFPSPMTTRDPSSFGAVPVVRADEPPEASTQPVPVAGDVSTPEPFEISEEHLVVPPRAEESFELPHYSDPPTGQVPRVVIDETDEQAESWSGLSGQPHWKGEGKPFGGGDDFSDLVDSGPRLGALDTSPSPSSGAEEFFDNDLDAPTSGFGDGQDVVPTSRRDAARTAVRRQPRPRPRRGGGGGGGEDYPPSSTGRNLPMAFAVGIGLLAVGGLCFKLGDIATTILIAVVLTLCAVELFSTLRDSGYNPATLLGLAAVPALAIAPLGSPTYAYPIVLGLTVIAGLIWYLYVNPGPGTVGNLGVTLLGIFWIGGLGSFATLILGVGRTAQHAEHLKSNPGLGVIWGVVLVTVSYDVGAYFIGRFFGHAPLSPASPNKTMEGLFGGIAVGIFLPLLILKLADLHPLGNNVLRAFYFCLFCALVAPVGDLCESALKRDLEVKDMGDLLPGHGGVLDRFDGFLFVLPVAWFMVHLLGIHPF